MKTVRFASLVESGGKPDTHLLLVKPEADKALQKAIKGKRVVTVYQSSVGQTADHGEVGFHAGPSRQYLVFPRSVSAFDGRKVVGIKYELLESAPIPKSQQATRPEPRPRKSTEREKKVRKKDSARRVKEEEPEPVPPEKLVKFPVPTAAEDEDDSESEAIEELKTQVRKAMGELEKGKQVAAFNLLKRIVAD